MIRINTKFDAADMNVKALRNPVIGNYGGFAHQVRSVYTFLNHLLRGVLFSASQNRRDWYYVPQMHHTF